TVIAHDGDFPDTGLVSIENERGFRATRTALAIVDDGVALPPASIASLDLQVGASVGVTTPLKPRPAPAAEPAGELDARPSG
ncbi:MAG: hypothetical protein ACYTGG_06120, partial [Planctomycetota bacterium]